MENALSEQSESKGTSLAFGLLPSSPSYGWASPVQAKADCRPDSATSPDHVSNESPRRATPIERLHGRTERCRRERHWRVEALYYCRRSRITIGQPFTTTDHT
jgi:hypothetical protein